MKTILYALMLACGPMAAYADEKPVVDNLKQLHTDVTKLDQHVADSNTQLRSDLGRISQWYKTLHDDLVGIGQLLTQIDQHLTQVDRDLEMQRLPFNVQRYACADTFRGNAAACANDICLKASYHHAAFSINYTGDLLGNPVGPGYIGPRGEWLGSLTCFN